MKLEYDIIVVGGGHAGCEAAVAAARMGSQVLLITMDMSKFAAMSCNPAVGGVAKGQIVREIDALGGQMGIITDRSTIQFRMLNRSKGAAMWSPRAQCDKARFSDLWRQTLENTPGLFLWQDSVVDLIVDDPQTQLPGTDRSNECVCKSEAGTDNTGRPVVEKENDLTAKEPIRIEMTCDPLGGKETEADTARATNRIGATESVVNCETGRIVTTEGSGGFEEPEMATEEVITAKSTEATTKGAVIAKWPEAVIGDSSQACLSPEAVMGDSSRARVSPETGKCGAIGGVGSTEDRGADDAFNSPENGRMQPQSPYDEMLDDVAFAGSHHSRSGLSYYGGMHREATSLASRQIGGVRTALGVEFRARAVILTAGTFLNGLIHVGRAQVEGGRVGDAPSKGLTERLIELGFEAGRMKTGTPARLDGRTIDFGKLTVQEGDDKPSKFSFSTDTEPVEQQLPCYIVNTSREVHDTLRTGFADSPLFNGTIKGVGPRYCPSIEDKLRTFADKDSHQLFLEPEGLTTNEYYLNGFSSSLPWQVQMEALRRIEGLETVQLYRPGYAIEYDYFPPTQLLHTLQTKLIPNLYFAGQINGTTGYEEAAAQGLIAGINAHIAVSKMAEADVVGFSSEETNATAHGVSAADSGSRETHAVANMVGGADVLKSDVVDSEKVRENGGSEHAPEMVAGKDSEDFCSTISADNFDVSKNSADNTTWCATVGPKNIGVAKNAMHDAAGACNYSDDRKVCDGDAAMPGITAAADQRNIMSDRGNYYAEPPTTPITGIAAEWNTVENPINNISAVDCDSTTPSERFVLRRDEAYIGVLIDDLVTKGVDEPYRMFTSRAEYRILLRGDNADLRLTPRGREIGLIDDARWRVFEQKKSNVESLKNFVNGLSIAPDDLRDYLISLDSAPLTQGRKLSFILSRNEIRLRDVIPVIPALKVFVEANNIKDDEIEEVEIEIKYKGYVEREKHIAKKLRRLEEIAIPANFDFKSLRSLTMEARQKLTRIRPTTIGQASRIPGVSPADINVLLVYFGR